MPRTGWTAEQLKQKALDAAEDVIRKSGFERSKLTDVARDLGVSHATLYKHFTSKEELLDAVTRRWLSHIDDDLATICQGPESPSQRIKAWFLALHQFKRAKVLADPELFAAFQISRVKEMGAASQHLKIMHAQLQGLIQEAIAAGEVQAGDSTQLAHLLFNGTMAFHYPRLVYEYLHQERDQELTLLLDTLLKGLAA